MRARLKRWVMLATGWFFVVLGIAGLFLPVPQGILFTFIGLLILSSEYVWAHRLLERVKRRFPALPERALHESGRRIMILARGKRRADLQQLGLILQNASAGEGTRGR
jgi:hypothetical protein